MKIYNLKSFLVSKLLEYIDINYKDKYNEENVIERYGKSNLELYRLKRGIQEILSHSKSLPFIPGYVRKKKENEQLCLFEIND